MIEDSNLKIGEYRDDVHAEVLDDVRIGEHGYKHRMVDGIVMPPYITPARYRLSRSLETRAGDICYTSYPKSGSTWLAYILVLLVNGGEAPSDTTLRNCLHWVASSWTYPRTEEELRNSSSPRILKSHMPYQMALGGEPHRNPCKYVYIARNPKDVAVSYYYFERGKSWSGGYSGPWEHWLKMFMEGTVQRGDWFDHVLSWWHASRAANIHFLKYEDLCRDFEKQAEQLARFLGCAISAEILQQVHSKTAFQTMSTTAFSNMEEIREFGGFFRRGEIGSWRDEFTPSQSDAFDELCARRLRGTGLEFDFGQGST